jgi:hypothetical protein
MRSTRRPLVSIGKSSLTASPTGWSCESAADAKADEQETELRRILQALNHYHYPALEEMHP